MGWSNKIEPKDGFYWIQFNIDLPPSQNWISFFEEARAQTPNPKFLRTVIIDRYLLIGINSDEDVDENLKKLAYELVEKTNELINLEQERIKNIKEKKQLDKQKTQETIQKIEKKIKETFD